MKKIIILISYFFICQAHVQAEYESEPDCQTCEQVHYRHIKDNFYIFTQNRDCFKVDKVNPKTSRIDDNWHARFLFNLPLPLCKDNRPILTSYLLEEVKMFMGLITDHVCYEMDQKTSGQLFKRRVSRSLCDTQESQGEVSIDDSSRASKAKGPNIKPSPSNQRSGGISQ